jgi:hypothetical protein
MGDADAVTTATFWNVMTHSFADRYLFFTEPAASFFSIKDGSSSNMLALIYETKNHIPETVIFKLTIIRTSNLTYLEVDFLKYWSSVSQSLWYGCTPTSFCFP